MHACLVCEGSLEKVLSFGKMPIANGFLSPSEYSSEFFFDLGAAFCPRCGMVQLSELVKQEKMFHDQYAFHSSTSTRMAQHFKEFSEEVRARFLKPSDPFVVEIGSNDGIMLRNFAAAGIRHLGIEPSANVAEIARRNGVRTVSRFFDEAFAREVVAEYGQADAFLGANVMCHIPYLHSVIEGIRTLLKPDGILIYEDPYLGDIVEKNSYDQIYDEHAFYFSVGSVNRLFEQHGMEVVDVAPQDVHGGSMRYYIAHKGKRAVSAAVERQRAREDALGLNSVSTYHELRKRIERSRDELMELLRNAKRQGKCVVGYGATSKSTTVTNYCGITPDLVEFISDTTPIKQGKFSPGAHIPVRPYSEFSAKYPDYALLFAWNHAAEILAKERQFAAKGGKWITYVPKVSVS